MIALLYVAAVAAANLAVTAFGPAVVPFTSFVLIGFVITTRDMLHERWRGRGMVWRMGAVIAAGGAVSYAINAEAASIAIASMVAFAASETLNALVYEPLLRRGVPWLKRVNAGNVFNAASDSAVFVLLAFGPALWPLIVVQTLAKIAGGFVWSLVWSRYRSEIVIERAP